MCFLCLFLETYPEFGQFLKEKEEKIANFKMNCNPLADHVPEIHRPAYKLSQQVPKIKVQLQ